MKKIILIGLLLYLPIQAKEHISFQQKVSIKINNSFKKSKLFLYRLANKAKIKPSTKVGESAYEFLEKNNPILLENNQTLNNKVRVLLIKASEMQDGNWTLKLKSEKGFLVQPKEGSKRILIKNSSIILFLKESKLYIKTEDSNARCLISNSLEFSPISSYLVINGTPYNGSLTIHIESNTPYVINTVSMNDYLFSVLKSEIYPSWPKEMLKVQAVTSRTYAMHHILKSRKTNKLFDIKSSNTHQNYKGLHTYIHLKDVIEETNKTIIAYKKLPALAMFDICCGGSKPADMRSINFNKAPYLARKKPCIFCKDKKHFQWKAQFNPDEFMKTLQTHTKLKEHNIGKLKNIKIIDRDKGGIIHKVKIIGTKKSILCSGRTLLESTKYKIKSLSFNLIKDNNLIFYGNGYGHQIGLCQLGALELVKQGWNFEEILKFYFPNTSLQNG